MKAINKPKLPPPSPFFIFRDEALSQGIFSPLTLAQTWREADDNCRRKYERQYHESQAKYLRDLKVYKDLNGDIEIIEEENEISYYHLPEPPTKPDEANFYCSNDYEEAIIDYQREMKLYIKSLRERPIHSAELSEEERQINENEIDHENTSIRAENIEDPPIKPLAPFEKFKDELGAEALYLHYWQLDDLVRKQYEMDHKQAIEKYRKDLKEYIAKYEVMPRPFSHQYTKKIYSDTDKANKKITDFFTWKNS